MKIRELLQIKLWSKRTSWKICIGIGVFYGVVLLAVAAHDAIQRYWLSPGERRAARTALMHIDALQDVGTVSDADFDASEKQAERDVNIARNTAWTMRDSYVSWALSAYFLATKMERNDSRSSKFKDRIWVQKFMQSQIDFLGSSERDSSMRIATSETDAMHILRSELHKTLD
jgi:hypothetical protein